MKENLDLNQILFDELVEFPRKRLGISICEFCAEAHVGTATYSKAKKKEYQSPKSDPLDTGALLGAGGRGVSRGCSGSVSGGV